MQFNLNRQTWMKILKICLVITVILYVVDVLVDQRNRIDDLERKYSPIENKLAFLYSSYPIDYAFAAIEEKPREENFTLLFYVLVNQQRKIESLIQMNKTSINKKEWQEYVNRPNTQAIMYVNHLSKNIDEINNTDWERLNKLEKRWKSFEKSADTLIDSGNGSVLHPTWLAGKYTELVESLNKIDGIESWYKSDS